MDVRAALMPALARSRVFPVLLLALGLVVRLAAVGQARFDRDEALSWVTALDLAEGKKFPSLGPGISDSDASTPGPLFHYLMALPQLFSTDPRAGGVFTALLNLGALWIVFLTIRRAWAPQAACLFLLLSICSPWMVVYADRIWSANVLVPLGAATIYCVVRMLRRAESRAGGPLAFILATGAQFHLSCICLWPLALVPIAAYRPRLNARWLAAGTALGILAYAPYVAHELGTAFSNTRLMLAQVPGHELHAGSLAGLILHFLGLATTDVSFLIARGYWYGFDHVEFWKQGGVARTQEFYAAAGAAPLLWTYQVVGWILTAVGLLCAGADLRAGGERRRRLCRNPFAVVFLAGLASIFMLYGLSRRGGFAHYVLPLALLAPLPAVALLRRLLRFRWIAPVVLLYALGAPGAGILILGAYYRADSRQSIPQQERIVAFVLERTGGTRPFELNFAWPEGRAVTYALLARRHHHAPWPAASRAADVFTVMPREMLESGPAAPGRVEAVERLDTLAVVHSRR